MVFTEKNIKSTFAAMGIYHLNRYFRLRKVPAYDPVKHPDPFTRYDNTTPNNQAPLTPIISNHIPSFPTDVPATPTTPHSLKTLGNDLVISASNCSLSPSKIQIHTQKVIKLLHSAQFAYAKFHLIEQARFEQKDKDRRKRPVINFT